MRKVNTADVPEQPYESPGGKYRSAYREISVALGREPESTDLRKRHPFDLEFSRVLPGAAICPYHEHTAQWEMYLIVAGRGLVRDAGGITEVGPGDAFIFAPGEAHQLSNPGPNDLVYYCIADNPVGDTCYYPDSGKWLVRQGDERHFVRGAKIDYYDGEE